MSEEFSIQTVELAADRFSQVSTFLKLLREFDLQKLPAVFDAIGRVREADTVDEMLGAVADTLPVLADATRNEVDDQVADAISKILSGPVRPILVRIIEARTKRSGDVAIQGETMTSAVLASEQELSIQVAIDPALVSQIVAFLLPLISNLLRERRDRRG